MSASVITQCGLRLATQDKIIFVHKGKEFEGIISGIVLTDEVFYINGNLSFPAKEVQVLTWEEGATIHIGVNPVAMRNRPRV